MRILIGLLIAFSLVSSAFAETLQTAKTAGKGKWQVGASYMSNTNVWSFIDSGVVGSTVGVSGNYGLSDSMDLILSAADEYISGGTIPSGTKIEKLNFGVAAKFVIMNESKGSPAVAGTIGYKWFNSQISDIGGSAENQIFAGLSVSKSMDMLTPYASLVYRQTTPQSFMFWIYDTSDQVDLTVGTALNWSKDGSLFVEYTSEMIQQRIYNGYTSSQIALGVGYKL
jgi:hypothetical protein